MCHFKVWFHDEDKGYVMQCLQCHKIQIGYGMLSLNFEMQAFDRFRRDIAGYFSGASSRRCPMHVKSMLIPTPCEGMNLLLSYKELDFFHRMLEAVDNDMKAEGLLQCFKELN